MRSTSRLIFAAAACLISGACTQPHRAHAQGVPIMSGQSILFTGTLPVSDGTQSGGWRTMDTAPRDGTIIEIQNNYGAAPTYGLFRWTDKMWGSDEWCKESAAPKLRGALKHVWVSSISTCTSTPFSGATHYPATLLPTGHPGWMAPNANTNGGSGLINEPQPESGFRWRPFHGDAAHYVDPTNGAQFTEQYWRGR